MLIDNDHHALAEFPTETFGSWNWYSIGEKAHGFDLKNLPPDYQCIVQPISDFHFSRRLGSIFELKFGKGKLLVCGYNIRPERDHFPEVRQLRHSLISYMNSSNFNPEYSLSESILRELFHHSEMAVSKAPEGFTNAQLYIESASLQDEPGNNKWSQSIDKIITKTEVDYSVSSDGTWKEETGTAWFGKNMSIQLTIPSGSIGKVYLFFHDWSNQNRDGTIEIEKRKYGIGSHDNSGKWISLDFMREDTQDGEIIIRTKCTSGPNLMITKMAVMLL